MDEVEPCLDERWSDLAIFIDRQSAGQQVVTVESRAQQPPRPELCPHRCNHFAREAQPVLEAAAILVGSLVRGGRKECVHQIPMRRMQLQQLETGLHCAPCRIAVVLHDSRDLLTRQLDRHPLSRRPRNSRRSECRRLRYDALRTAMPELEAGHGAFRAHRLRDVGQPGDHPIVMGTELCVKCAAAGIVGERDLDDDQPRPARCAGPVVLDVLSRRTAICIGIHGAHGRLHDAIAKRDAADADRKTQSRKQQRRTIVG